MSNFKIQNEIQNFNFTSKKYHKIHATVIYVKHPEFPCHDRKNSCYNLNNILNARKSLKHFKKASVNLFSYLIHPSYV